MLVGKGKPDARFEFGKNWRRFLNTVDEWKISEAEESLRNFLDARELKGRTFLDAGCGSGLFSLAARRLGAEVVSFDLDSESTGCARELKRRWFPDDPGWAIREGSVLDRGFLGSLGAFDIVYSWGVLHHTGDMYAAMGNIAALVKDTLFISIYNDQGAASRVWKSVKRAYNKTPGPLKFLILIPAFVRLWGPTTIVDILRGRPFHSWINHKKRRGMNPWVDVIDWVGGYPFEVAKPEEIFDFYRERGFSLLRLKTCGGGRGCNEFVFRRIPGGVRDS